MGYAWMAQALIALIGFSSGFIVAGGVVALIVGLGIVTRYIGITRTADRIFWCEDAIFLGAVAGTLLTVYNLRLPLGEWVLGLGGLFVGIFVGSWILALAEVVNVFPVYCRRLGITKGLSWIVITMALGKVSGSLLGFYMRWGKG